MRISDWSSAVCSSDLDIDVLRERLTGWARERLDRPDRVAFDVIVAAEGGASSETWLVDARVGEDRRLEKWVLRIEPRGHQVYQDPSVRRQYRVIETLATRPEDRKSTRLNSSH